MCGRLSMGSLVTTVTKNRGSSEAKCLERGREDQTGLCNLQEQASP